MAKIATLYSDKIVVMTIDSGSYTIDSTKDPKAYSQEEREGMSRISNRDFESLVALLERFGNELRNKDTKLKQRFGNPEKQPEEVFNPEPHYNNQHGSLYKIAEQRGWNSYVFDVVKRLDRAGKKENNPVEQEIDKTINLLKLWKQEL